MEFLAYQRTAEQLAKLGLIIEETDESDETSLSMSIDDDDEKILVISATGTPAPVINPDALRLSTKQGFGHAAETVLGLAHIGEVVLIPARTWRDVLDIAAFDLAQHERWLDIDQEATLHQNGRDPLVVPPNDKHIVGVILNACVEQGASRGSNLFVTTFDAPLIIEAHHEGYLRVHCLSEAVRDNLAGGFEPA